MTKFVNNGKKLSLLTKRIVDLLAYPWQYYCMDTIVCYGNISGVNIMEDNKKELFLVNISALRITSILVKCSNPTDNLVTDYYTVGYLFIEKELVDSGKLEYVYMGNQDYYYTVFSNYEGARKFLVNFCEETKNSLLKRIDDFNKALNRYSQ